MDLRVFCRAVNRGGVGCGQIPWEDVRIIFRWSKLALVRVGIQRRAACTQGQNKPKYSTEAPYLTLTLVHTRRARGSSSGLGFCLGLFIGIKGP